MLLHDFCLIRIYKEGWVRKDKIPFSTFEFISGVSILNFTNYNFNLNCSILGILPLYIFFIIYYIFFPHKFNMCIPLRHFFTIQGPNLLTLVLKYTISAHVCHVKCPIGIFNPTVGAWEIVKYNVSHRSSVVY